MRILLPFFAFIFLGLTACDGQKTAGERTQEIETFADPAIQSLNKAKGVQSTLDASEAARKTMEDAATETGEAISNAADQVKDDTISAKNAAEEALKQ